MNKSGPALKIRTTSLNCFLWTSGTPSWPQPPVAFAFTQTKGHWLWCLQWIDSSQSLAFSRREKKGVKSRRRDGQKEKVSLTGRATVRQQFWMHWRREEKKKEYNGLSGLVLVCFTLSRSPFLLSKSEQRPFWQIFHTDLNQLQASSID